MRFLFRFYHTNYIVLRSTFNPKQLSIHPFNLYNKFIIQSSFRNMSSQKSITSFFKVKPKTPENKEKQVAETENHNKNYDEAPETNRKVKRLSKRLRSDSSEDTIKAEEKSPPSSVKKKKVKRQRIESSGSEDDAPKSGPSSPDIKLEKSENTPKTYASPKNKKSALKTMTPLLEKNKKVKTEKSSDNKESKVKSDVSLSESIKKESNDDSTAKEKDNQSREIKNQQPQVSELEYNPNKSKYHPVKDACWLRGQPVPYLALARTLDAIEATSARLKIVEILSNYFRSVIALTPEDLLPSIYMCLNQLAPAYHNLELGIAETYLMKVVGQCTGQSVAQVRAAAARAGSLSAAACRARNAQRTLRPHPPLRARHLLAQLRAVARTAGQDSVNKKIALIKPLFNACRDCEAKFLIRSLEGKLRIGLAEQSVLQALAVATATTPPDPEGVKVLDASKGVPSDEFKARVDEHALIIKTTYCECPNYDAVVPVLLQKGVAALPEHCRLTAGVPLKPMLAHPTKGVLEIFNRLEGQQFTCEWKYDGERAQIHVPEKDGAPDFSRVAIFSRNQEDNTGKYPDVLSRLDKLLAPGVTSCVLDCEVVAFDPASGQILPFQVLSTRKRKDVSQGSVAVQVCVFVFDLLLLGGRALVRLPLRERRRLLRESVREVPGEWQLATSMDCSSSEEVQQFLEEALRGSCEGLMVKTLDGDHAHYDIARRSHNWLKLKKDYLEGVGDTIDAVVIGAYWGKGKRAGQFGGFLLALPLQDELQALCRLGTGFSDLDLATFTKELTELKIENPPNYYIYDPSHAADVWVREEVVWEVRAADVSLSAGHRVARGHLRPDRGLSLRFPRFVRARPDKTPEQATSGLQLVDMYLAQDQVRNCAQPQQDLDDFY